ncbi:predicted protein [Chaetomium globosum CBS 148.51]|uniref:Uncharacterized protein n=1 Tax=Chaetomium globosum (strain ATCC 6205 / CBS 148.51 / DSM 1962 / NBRC 6347 / NRRL 1970) TaxID=306901 RepID=Q2GUU9_CHAGB|nr:uncharacterized protein CHGG_08255 [Chaetomium globosum CBS 148.51]EAQ87002.1 predicted protein [Chaetomium globosum CBS 148.51]
MSPAEQATPKCHARAAVGRRANTLRLVLRKLCGDIKDGDQRPNPPDQEQAQQPPAAEAAPENVALQPDDHEDPLTRLPNESLDIHNMRTGNGSNGACSGPTQERALRRRKKPPNPFRNSSLNASTNNTPHGAMGQPNAHSPSGAGHTSGRILDQTHAEHPPATRTLPVLSPPSCFEEAHPLDAGATDPIDDSALPPYVRSDLMPTPTTYHTPTPPTQSPGASYQAHPLTAATTVTRATPSPPYITPPTHHDANHHHNNHNNPPPFHPPSHTNLQYTSMRLALITDIVQLTPNGTGVRVTNRREALQRAPEALGPV